VIRALTVAALLVLPVASAAGQKASATSPKDRAALEQQFRERAAKVMQKRLGLTEAQMTQLEASNRKFGPQLAMLAAQERETRRLLRTEIANNNNADQKRVSDLLDASIRYQQQRITIVQAEQQDLARFMTPVQRARYLAFQGQLRRRTEELAGRKAQRGGAKARRPAPARVP
jgi:periplasmic protein CpxP/Spy